MEHTNSLHNHSIKLSIVIPVYNAELFLNDCLNSILGQNIPKNLFEVICVDDGSSDNSPEILSEFAANYPNLTVISKPNGGVSSARNEAIPYIRGQYVWFIDADDSIAPNCFSTILEIIDLHSPSIMKLNFNKVPFDYSLNDTSTNNRYTYSTHSGVISNSTVCGSIITSSIITENNLRFNSQMKYGEDTLFMYYVFLYSPYTCWASIKEPIYNYRTNPQSAMHQTDMQSYSRHTKDLILMGHIYKNEYASNTGLDSFKLDNTYKRQHLAIMGALTIFPKSSLDYTKTMQGLKDAGLYPFPFLMWHIKNTPGLKLKIVEFIKLFFKFEILYKIYYAFVRKNYLKK